MQKLTSHAAEGGSNFARSRMNRALGGGCVRASSLWHRPAPLLPRRSRDRSGYRRGRRTVAVTRVAAHPTGFTPNVSTNAFSTAVLSTVPRCSFMNSRAAAKLPNPVALKKLHYDGGNLTLVVRCPFPLMVHWVLPSRLHTPKDFTRINVGKDRRP